MMIPQLATISQTVPQPLPQVDVTIRPGVMEDVPFLDSLQRLHTKQVGWMPTKQFEGKIKLGHVLVAWASRPCSSNEDTGGTPVPREERVGYCIGNDQYFKRDDVGIIYQMNVAPGRQQGFIGASLLKAQFERSAYGCKLYCCWCAQDIEANKFWEAMGFVPLAFRAGSEKKSRVHIFWQKRIRAGDCQTPWWFPAKTAGGSIREDRIVLPIPPGTHWSAAKPLIFPEVRSEPKALPQPTRAMGKKAKIIEEPEPTRRNGLVFDIPQPGDALPETKPAKQAQPRAAREKRACDPKLVSAARELRDRWLEEVNAGRALIEPIGKYDPARTIEGDAPAAMGAAVAAGGMKLLSAA